MRPSLNLSRVLGVAWRSALEPGQASRGGSRGRLAGVGLGAVLLCGAVRGQSDPASPLPDALKAHVIPPDRYAAELILEDDDLTNDLLSTMIGFDNTSEQDRVVFDWSFQDGVSSAGLRRTEESVSFAVTAVAPRAPSGQVLFVAGWNERSGTPLVERWEFGSFALGSVASPETGSPKSVVLLPSLTKRELWEGQAGSGLDVPIAGLAYHVPSQALWLLTSETSPRLLTLDLSVPGNVPPPQVAATVTTQPFLSGARSLKAARLSTGGFFLLVQERLLWEGTPSQANAIGSILEAGPPPPAPTLLVLADLDGDGVNELDATYTYAEFRSLYPAASWDMTFAVP